MVRVLLSAALVFGAFLVVPAASAVPLCAPSGNVVSAGGEAYVENGAGYHLWLEANDIPGLQKAACKQNLQIHPADTYVSEIPPELIGKCVKLGPLPFICL